MPFVLTNRVAADFQTNDNVEVTAVALDVPASSIFAAHLVVMAQAADNTTGVWELWAAGRRIGTNAAEIIGNAWIQADMVQSNWVQGGTVQNFAALQDSSWAAQIAVDGATLPVKVSGAGAQVVNWYMNGDLNTAVPVS